MKKLFPGKNKKKFVGGAAILLIIGLTAASPFLVILSSFAASFSNSSFCDTMPASGSSLSPHIFKDTCHNLVDHLSPNEKNLIEDHDFMLQLENAFQKGAAVTIDDSFRTFCTDSYRSNSTKGQNCQTQAASFHSFLSAAFLGTQIPDWPVKTLNYYAHKKLLFNPGSKAPIQTQQDFLTAIPAGGLKDLLTNDQNLLKTLWNYDHGL
jgi:hypothetical protein